MKKLSTFAVIVLTVLFVAGCSRSPTSHPGNSQPTNVNNGTSGNTAVGSAGNDAGGATGNQVAAGDSGSANTASNPGGSSNGAPQFAGYIVDIMNYVQQQTSMPVFAPTGPTFTPKSTAVSAQVFRSASSYNVDLFATAKPLAINDPSLDVRGTGTEIANFDGQAYASSAAAMQALQASAQAFPVDHSLPSTQVDLGEGITALQYPYKASNVPSNFSVLEWHEGKWTIDVYGTPSLDLVAQAKQVVNYLHVNFLPMTNGLLQVNPPGATGPSTSLSWVFGKDMYFCSAKDSMTAMELAVSMREYPSYRIVP